MTEARAETLLAAWAQWMRRHDTNRLGYPPKASGGIEVYTSNMDFDLACEHMDNDIAAATDAVVEGMSPLFRASLYATLLDGAWNFPQADLAPIYSVAVQHVARGLERKGIE